MQPMWPSRNWSTPCSSPPTGRRRAPRSAPCACYASWGEVAAMPDVALIYDPALDDYDLGEMHPLRPERVAFSVSLMEALGLLGDGPGRARTVAPSAASDDDLLLVHSRAYVDAVKRCSAPPYPDDPAHGLGTADNPVAPRMHETSALICGGAVLGLAAVLDGRAERTFNVAGGLHHAHRDRAAGFCVYNDPAVAIAAARRDRPGVRLAYLDIDAHHGDGVEEAFYETDEILTISLHESGRYLFPGTGFPSECGTGDGAGFALNVPMPPYASDACYALAFERVVAPALRAFAPAALVMQCGADAHFADPLTSLGLTLDGHRSLVRGAVTVAREAFGGRIAACGGGGYAWWSVVPLAWTNVLAELLEAEPDDETPEPWRASLADASGRPAPY
ncbi:MAG: acetoin utilization protein AcuC, partial [Actinobacteria bacterium]